MKTLKLFVFGILFISATQAQISVNVNLGTPPAWAPAKSIATQYYFLPEIDSYYDLPTKQFIFPYNGKWLKAKKLPKQYKNYNLRKSKVDNLTDYRGDSPCYDHKKHKNKYQATRLNPNKAIYVQKHNNGKYKDQKKYYKNNKHCKNNKHYKYND